MLNFKKLLFLFFLTLIIVLVGSFFSKNKYTGSVVMGGKTYFVNIADTFEDRALGLSGTKTLSDREGLFFIFPKDDKYGFWMKDMLFAIDIIWMDKDFKVVHIEKDVKPETYPNVFGPNTPARYVLEVSSGQAEQLNLKIGDSVVFSEK